MTISVAQRPRKKAVLVAAVVPGLFLYFADLFMVPGYFDWGFAFSLSMFFLFGLLIALFAGRKYCMQAGATEPSFGAVFLSPPVLLYVAGILLISCAGYLNYTPKPKGH